MTELFELKPNRDLLALTVNCDIGTAIFAQFRHHHLQFLSLNIEHSSICHYEFLGQIRVRVSCQTIHHFHIFNVIPIGDIFDNSVLKLIFCEPL